MPPEKRYVVLEARFRPAAAVEGAPALYSAYMVVRGEVGATSLSEAMRKAKRLQIAPIIEEKQSFWARIEAAKVLKNASLARGIYERNST